MHTPTVERWHELEAKVQSGQDVSSPEDIRDMAMLLMVAMETFGTFKFLGMSSNMGLVDRAVCQLKDWLGV